MKIAKNSFMPVLYMWNLYLQVKLSASWMEKAGRYQGRNLKSKIKYSSNMFFIGVNLCGHIIFNKLMAASTSWSWFICILNLML